MYYAFIPFYHWTEVADEKPKNDEFNGYILGHVTITTNHIIALSLYAETLCPASQLVEANSMEELSDKIKETKNKFRDPECVSWFEETYL